MPRLQLTTALCLAMLSLFLLGCANSKPESSLSPPQIQTPQIPESLLTCDPIPLPPQIHDGVILGSELNDWLADVLEAHADCAEKLKEIRALLKGLNA